jgi:hypothetical protein
LRLSGAKKTAGSQAKKRQNVTARLQQLIPRSASAEIPRPVPQKTPLKAQGLPAASGFASRTGAPRAPEGFNGALKRLIPNLDAALQRFRKRAQDDPAIKLRLARGYDTNAVRGGSR